VPGLIDNAQGRRVDARVRNTRPPKIKLPIQVFNIAEGAHQEEVLPDIAERPLNPMLPLQSIVGIS